MLFGELRHEDMCKTGDDTIQQAFLLLENSSDDITGGWLDTSLVKAGCQDEPHRSREWEDINQLSQNLLCKIPKQDMQEPGGFESTRAGPLIPKCAPDLSLRNLQLSSVIFDRVLLAEWFACLEDTRSCLRDACGLLCPSMYGTTYKSDYAKLRRA